MLRSTISTNETLNQRESLNKKRVVKEINESNLRKGDCLQYNISIYGGK